MYTSQQFFNDHLETADHEIYKALLNERQRQKNTIELIAPKNYMSRAARLAMNSFISYTSVEGYPNKRYHSGTANIDIIESTGINRAKIAFNCSYANLQPHSGTQANQAVLFALLNLGDKILSMDLKSGGHLSHGLKSNFSGKFYNVEFYSVDDYSGLIDYDRVEEQAIIFKPKLIIVGGSSYPRQINFERFKIIADRVGAYLMADIAHFSGLVAAGLYNHPFPHCDVVTTTTNKNLRGPRGGLILANDESIGRKIDGAVFPGIQGGPLPEIMTAKAVSLKEASDHSFKNYAYQMLKNARAICETFKNNGFKVVTGGTDTPLIMIDLSDKNFNGHQAQVFLENLDICCNKNLIPNDKRSPQETTGIRMGVSAITTRGFDEVSCIEVANLIIKALDSLNNDSVTDELKIFIKNKVSKLSEKFPLYPFEIGCLD